MRLPLAIIAVVSSLAACGRDPALAPHPIEQLPRPLSVAERDILAASNAFAFGLLREVNASHAGRNVFISPLSASMALGMTMNGARGSTLDGMRAALGLGGLEMPAINGAYRSLIALLLELDPTVDMRIANSIWAQAGTPFEDDFFSTATTHFGATVRSLDFRDPATLPAINDWVKTATGNRIPTILDEIRPEEVMFLINAIYFKGRWTTPFDRARTHDMPFHRAGGSTVPVPMMTRDGTVAYAANAQVEMVELPYGGDAFRLTLVVPRAGTGADAVVAGLTPEYWDALVTGLADRRVVVGLPRFRIEWNDELNEPLKRLGMTDAFDEIAADFRGMSSAIGDDLYISRVRQKTFVDVNEEGTEAAAATVVGVGIVSMPPQVIADRPFVVAIRERHSGAILFIGKIADPTA